MANPLPYRHRQECQATTREQGHNSGARPQLGGKVSVEQLQCCLVETPPGGESSAGKDRAARPEKCKKALCGWGSDPQRVVMHGLATQ